MSDTDPPVTLEEQLRACRADLEALRETQRRAVESLRESEGMIRQVVEASPMGMHFYRLEDDGSLIFTGANPAADRILGVDHRQYVGKKIEEAFPPLAGTEVPARYRHVCTTGEPFATEQLDYEDERIRGAFEVHAFRAAPGNVATLFLDISERKRAEQALRESEEQYRLLVENAGDGIFIAQDGVVRFANRRASQMAGYGDAREVTGRSMLDFISPEDHALVFDRHVRRLRGEDVPSTYALRMRRKDGTTFWTQLNAVTIEWKGQPASLNFIRDISEQKRLEEQLAAAERLRSVGTLAGGIAHDFNNILMGIQGNVSLLLLSLAPESPLRARLEEIEHCVESGAELSARILGFAQGGQYNPVATDLNGLVRASLEMFGRTRKEIAVHTACAGDLVTVEIDRAQIEQVLLNLFVNAWQAMPGGGDLFVETRNALLDEAQAAAAGIKPGRCAQVVVRDTGGGVDPAIQQRIFEPFFTTKDRGRGTGLGLASAYGIMKHHGGSIGVQSAPGQGAIFTITLPASGKTVVAPPPPPGDGVKRRHRAAGRRRTDGPERGQGSARTPGLRGPGRWQRRAGPRTVRREPRPDQRGRSRHGHAGALRRGDLRPAARDRPGDRGAALERLQHRQPGPRDSRAGLRRFHPEAVRPAGAFLEAAHRHRRPGAGPLKKAHLRRRASPFVTAAATRPPRSPGLARLAPGPF